jgi:hypothetical protein
MDSARAISARSAGREYPWRGPDSGRPVRRHHHCRAPNRSALSPTGMLQRILNSASAWLQALRNKITSALLPAYEFYGEGPEVSLDRSAKVLTPDVVKDELAVDERIDAIKRLVQTKAMKQMLVGKCPPRLHARNLWVGRASVTPMRRRLLFSGSTRNLCENGSYFASIYSCLASTRYRRGFKSSRCAEHGT